MRTTEQVYKDVRFCGCDHLESAHDEKGCTICRVSRPSLGHNCEAFWEKGRLPHRVRDMILMLKSKSASSSTIREWERIQEWLDGKQYEAILKDLQTRRRSNSLGMQLWLIANSIMDDSDQAKLP